MKRYLMMSALAVVLVVGGAATTFAAQVRSDEFAAPTARGGVHGGGSHGGWNSGSSHNGGRSGGYMSGSGYYDGSRTSWNHGGGYRHGHHWRQGSNGSGSDQNGQINWRCPNGAANCPYAHR